MSIESFKVKKSLGFKAQAAAPVSPDIGEMYLSTDGNHYRWDGDAWRNLASGGATTFAIEQTSHAFTVGTAIYHNGTIWAKARADNGNTLSTAVVVEVTDANNFVAANFGRFEAIAHGFTVGQFYYLSELTAGLPTVTEPIAPNFSCPLFYVESANFIQVLCYRPARQDLESYLGSNQYSADSTAAQTVINLGFYVHLDSKPNFDLYIDGAFLREGAANDYQFTNIVNNQSNQVTLNSPIAAGLNIVATYRGIYAVTNALANPTLGTSGSVLRLNGSNPEWNNSINIAADGKVGIGTSSPATTFGGLDIASGGIGLVIGADDGATTRTNATEKHSRFASYHYTNAEEPFCLINGRSTATVNMVNIGGGTGALNAATEVKFYTAANQTTTVGTERMRIDSSGDVTVSSTGAKTLSVYGTTASDASTINIGNSTTAGTCNLNLVSASGSIFRIQRNAGTNGTTFIDHQGTGTLYLRTINAAPFNLETNSVLRMAISATGVYQLNSLTTNGTLTTTGSNGTLAVSSNSNLKITDGEIQNALSKVNAITPRYFYWKSETGFGEQRQLGFYAQEVNQALGEEVANTPADGVSWGIYDRGLVAMAYKAIQELSSLRSADSALISSLQSEAASQAEAIALLTARIEALENA